MAWTRKSDWLFIIPAACIWLVALLLSIRDFSGARRQTRSRPGWSIIVGPALMAVGVGIRLAARKALGPHFSYALRTLPGHRLVRSGIYQQVRHPAYTGDLLFQVGLALYFSSLRGAFMMLLLVPCFLYRIRIEEKMLAQEFGSEYLEYVGKSKKLIPGIY